MPASEHPTIVVGGGVVGAACAHYLAEAGERVVILDKDRFAGACSHANCGLISPSHVLPLAEPGVLGMGLKSFFQKNSPFKIHLRPDWRLISWLLHFGKRCNHEDMLESAKGIQPLLDSSRALYDDLTKSGGLACEWQPFGLLFVFRTSHGMEHYAELNKFLHETFDAGAKRIAGDELVAMEPALKPGLAGAWYYERDAHLRPDVLMSSWKSSLQARGVEIRENCTALDFEKVDGRVVAVKTNRGTMPAARVIVATGALTPTLEKQLGRKIPIQPGKGYSMTMQRPKRCPKYSLLLPEDRVAVTPFDTGYRLGSIMEIGTHDPNIEPARLNLLREGAEKYLHEPTAEPVTETWTGRRPMTYDSRPIIDRAPVADNVWIAAGHNMLGLSMAPATGKLVAELALGKTPHIHPGSYRLNRF